jgi:hypothetical protein|tara:strand:- start:218 stop:655 length:438 start_codon:yes stop_codon:yes gene_type:complete
VIYNNILSEEKCASLFEKAKQLDWKLHHDEIYQKLEHRDFDLPEAKDILTSLNLGDKKILRVKFNLCLRRDKYVESWHHVDSVKPHTVIVYYLHDTDGDTVLTTEERFTPKRNTALVFDGSIEHWYIYPQKHDYRITLNIDIQDV